MRIDFGPADLVVDDPHPVAFCDSASPLPGSRERKTKFHRPQAVFSSPGTGEAKSERSAEPGEGR